MIQAVLHRLEYLVENLPEKFRQIPEEDFRKKSAAHVWSKQEILGHLIDSAVNNQQRFIRAQYEDIPSIRYDQDQWNNLNHYQENTREHVIQLWQAIHRQLLFLCERIPQESLSRLCNTGDPEPHTIQWLIADYVKHQEHHLRQILDYE